VNMQASTKTLYIVVDALRSDYVRKSKMPHLSKLAEHSVYVEHLIPSPGFCERVEILTGKENAETGYFTAIDRVDPSHENTPLLSFLSWCSICLEKIASLFHSYLIFRIRKRLASLVVSRVWPQFEVPTFNIPLSIYGQFGLSEDSVDQRLPSAFGVPSIVDDRALRGQTVNFQAFTSLGDKSALSNDQERMLFVENNLHITEDAVFFLYIGELDAMGHKFGPSSLEFASTLKAVDQSLSEFIARLQSKGQVELVIIGDHGMSDVTGSVDFISEVTREAKRLGITNMSDITIFCDSTVGRIWLRDDHMKNALHAALSKNERLREFGMVFGEQDYEKFSVPRNPERHGQILWFANSGVVVSPDYFYGEFCPKGMHGYLPVSEEHFGTAIFSGKDIKAKKISRAKLSSVPAIFEETFG
jgi:hypothetical protein